MVLMTHSVDAAFSTHFAPTALTAARRFTRKFEARCYTTSRAAGAEKQC
jgi:hypothetical protein